MARGIIYIMETAVDGLIKIGKTGLDNFEQRMYQLERHGYCNVSKLERRFAIEVDNYSEKELLLKKLFSRSLVGDSELYSLDLQQAIQLLSSFEGKQIYPKDETKQEVFEQASEAVESSCLLNGQYTLSSTVNVGEHKEKVSGTLKVEGGRLTLLKGAVLASESRINLKGYQKARDDAPNSNGVLLADIPCDSVSMAAAIVCGSNQNGWTKWKDKNGKFIDSYRNGD